MYAEPSRAHLKALLRHVASHPEEAAAKGNAARADMVRRFSPEVSTLVLRTMLECHMCIPEFIGHMYMYTNKHTRPWGGSWRGTWDGSPRGWRREKQRAKRNCEYDLKLRKRRS